jgi:hypothetical protein
MNISIDLDNTLFYMNFIKYANVATGFKYEMADLNTYKISESKFDVRYIDHCRYIMDSPEFTMNLELQGSFVEIEKWMRKALMNGHKLYAVTARPKSLVYQTIKQLEDIGLLFYFENIYFEQFYGSKKDIFQLLDIDCVIDDNPDVILDAYAIHKANDKEMMICAIKNENINYCYNDLITRTQGWGKSYQFWDLIKFVENVTQVEI